MKISEVIARRKWLPAIVWACLIIAASSLPGSLVRARLFPGCDKIVHFIEYMMLGIAVRYWTQDFNMVGLTGGIAFGIIDEFHQYFVPGRSASLFDLSADIGGFIFGYMYLKQRLIDDRKD